MNKGRELIRYLVMDVDGTLTDGKIYIGPSGEAMKAFHTKDGYGIANMLIPAGIEPVILTGRNSAIVMNRCRELGITRVYQGVADKLNVLLGLTDDYSAIAYIGDDLNDLPCIRFLKECGGLAGCPNDAADEVKASADFISGCNGGEGAVRDFIQWLLQPRESLS